jgi:hypothetical protein
LETQRHEGAAFSYGVMTFLAAAGQIRRAA